MPNKNYIKGVRKERKLVNQAKDNGLIAFRSAGSHSPIDVVIIDKQTKKITLIQAKPKSMSENKKKELFECFRDLNGIYETEFKVE